MNLESGSDNPAVLNNLRGALERLGESGKEIFNLGVKINSFIERVIEPLILSYSAAKISLY